MKLITQEFTKNGIIHKLYMNTGINFKKKSMKSFYQNYTIHSIHVYNDDIEGKPEPENLISAESQNNAYTIET